MVPNTRPLLTAAAIIASLGGRLLPAQAPEVDEVKRVIQAETATYYQRDAEGWKRTWIQDSSAIRTFITSSSYSVALGWDRFGPRTVAEIERSAPVAVHVSRTNYVLRIEGPLAWAEYDERTDMPGDSVPLLARQQRTLVKRNGEWRILSAGSFVASTYGASPRAVEGRLDGVGSDLSAANEHHDAIEVLQLSTRLFPRSSSAYAALGAAYASAGDTTGARRQYEKALAIDPQNERARAALAKLREKRAP
jgi:tetratricopeptide (TPR) repeat protein